MKTRSRMTCATLVGLAVCSAAAQASPVGPTIDWGDVAVSVFIGGVQATADGALNWVQSTDGTKWKLQNSVTWSAGSSSFVLDNKTWFDPDPVMFLSASATNNTAGALDYSFVFTAPLSPALVGNVNSHAELGVTLTDGLNDGATVKPVTSATYMLNSFDVDGLGGQISKNVDIGTASVLTAAETPDTKLFFYSADGSLSCATSCVSMLSKLDFNLSAMDSVGFSGKVVQTPVPLPAAAYLLGSALLGMCGLRRRRTAHA